MKDGKRYRSSIIILVIGILLVLTGIVYMFFFNKTVDPKEEIIDDNKNELIVYKNNDGILTKEKNKNNQKAFSIKVNDKEKARIIEIDDSGKKVILYDDDGLYLYDVDSKSSKKINLENSYDEYKMLFGEDKIVGILYNKTDDDVNYFSIVKNQKMFDDVNKGKKTIYSQLTNKYLSLTVDDKNAYLLNNETGSISLKYTSNNSDSILHYELLNGNKKYIIALSDTFAGNHYTKLYNSELKEIYDSDKEGPYIFKNDIGIKDDYLYLGLKYEDYQIYKYDFDGKLIKEDKITGVETIAQLVNNYIVYEKDGYLFIENIDNNEKKSITKWDNSWILETATYYSQKALELIGEKDKKEGIYIIVKYLEKDANGNIGIEYCYTNNKELKEYPKKGNN